jgi:hypothetical protein
MWNSRPVRSLEEDFSQIKFGRDVEFLRTLSIGARLDETAFGNLDEDISIPAINAPEAEEEDSIDGKYVTMELFNRIAELELESLDCDDIDNLLEGLADKELPEGDDEIAEAAEAIVAALIEARRVKFKATMGGKRKVKAATGYETRDGKIVKKKAGDVRKERMKRRKYRRRAKAKIAKYQRTRGKRLSAKRERMGLASDDSFSLELESILDESVSTGFGEYEDTVSRVARVMCLIEDHLGEEVGDVLESAYERMEEGLLSEGADAQAVMSPVLRVIARCLEEIDAEGND